MHGDFSIFSRTVPRCHEVSRARVANGWTPAKSRAMAIDTETRDYLTQLEEAELIDQQADILHFLYNTRYILWEEYRTTALLAGSGGSEKRSLSIDSFFFLPFVG